jgi:hypothetical protein
VRGWAGRQFKDIAIGEIDELLDQIAECRALPEL